MNKNRKKIAILINSLVAGGCERTAAFLINNLSDKSEFYLIMFEDSIHYQVPDDTHKWIVDNVEQTGMNRLFYTLTIPMACRRIRRYLKEKEIDVLITFNHLPATIGCRIKKAGWSGLLVVNEQIHCSTYISSFSNFISRGLKKRLIANLYPFADIIVANAEEIKNDLIENFSIDKQKIEVIGNPVDFSFIKTQALTKPKEVLVVKEQHEFIFIHIGRYVPQKNHNLLIEAFEKANIRNAKLWLIGGGKDLTKSIS
jgi:glycosyltransferase involved in cell wall biosynthesis